MPSTHINSKFPPEILGEIFLECVLTVELEDIPRSRSSLCSVCRHWRQIVETHARLWSTIYINLWCSNETLWPPASAVELFLKRSMDAPLEIHVLVAGWRSNSENDKVDTYTREVFPLLAAQVYRWQRVALSVNNTLANDIRSITFSKAERLQDVDISIVLDGGDSNEMASSGKEIAVISALAGAPNLRSLKWSSHSDLIMHHIVETFPLEQLTRLHFDFYAKISLSDLLHVMQKCTSVVEMKIEIFIGDRRGSLPLVVLPNMRILELSIVEGQYDILKYFDFPNLEIIVIDWCMDNIFRDEHDVLPISHYLSNSRHCVQVLLVNDSMLRVEELPTFLSNSAVFKIPIVQLRTSSPPHDIRDTFLEAVETRLPEKRRPGFGITPVDEVWKDSAMGWTDVPTYEKFKDYLTGLDNDDILCHILRQVNQCINEVES